MEVVPTEQVDLPRLVLLQSEPAEVAPFVLQVPLLGVQEFTCNLMPSLILSSPY